MGVRVRERRPTVGRLADVTAGMSSQISSDKWYKYISTHLNPHSPYGALIVPPYITLTHYNYSRYNL